MLLYFGARCCSKGERSEVDLISPTIHTLSHSHVLSLSRLSASLRLTKHLLYKKGDLIVHMFVCACLLVGMFVCWFVGMVVGLLVCVGLCVCWFVCVLALWVCVLRPCDAHAGDFAEAG